MAHQPRRAGSCSIGRTPAERHGLLARSYDLLVSGGAPTVAGGGRSAQHLKRCWAAGRRLPDTGLRLARLAVLETLCFRVLPGRCSIPPNVCSGLPFRAGQEVSVWYLLR